MQTHIHENMRQPRHPHPQSFHCILITHVDTHMQTERGRHTQPPMTPTLLSLSTLLSVFSSHIHTDTHAERDTRRHAYTHARPRRHTYKDTHTHIQRHTHEGTHTHTKTHTTHDTHDTRTHPSFTKHPHPHPGGHSDS